MENLQSPHENSRKRYVYKDNFAAGKIVFDCEAETKLEADEKYRKLFGKDVSKESNIACEIKPIEE